MKRLRTWTAISVTIAMAFALAPVISNAAVSSQWMASPTIAAAVKAGVLEVGTSYAAPSSFKDPKTGQPNGMVILIGQEAARRLGVRLNVVVTGWDTIIAGLQAQKYAIALAGLFETPVRLKVVDFVTFGNEGIGFLVKKDNHKINTAEDLDKPGVVIATVTGSGSEQMVKQHFTQATVRSLLSPSGGSGAPPEEVISGRADAAQYDAILTNAYLERYPMLKAVPADAFVHPLFPTPVGLAIRKDDPVLKSFLKSVVQDLTARGVLAKARKQWSTPELLLGQ